MPLNVAFFNHGSLAERPDDLRKHGRRRPGVTGVIEMLVHQIDDEKRNEGGHEESHDRSITNRALTDS